MHPLYMPHSDLVRHHLGHTMYTHNSAAIMTRVQTVPKVERNSVRTFDKQMEQFEL